MFSWCDWCWVKLCCCLSQAPFPTRSAAAPAWSRPRCPPTTWRRRPSPAASRRAPSPPPRCPASPSAPCPRWSAAKTGEESSAVPRRAQPPPRGTTSPSPSFPLVARQQHPSLPPRFDTSAWSGSAGRKIPGALESDQIRTKKLFDLLWFFLPF